MNISNNAAFLYPTPGLVLNISNKTKQIINNFYATLPKLSFN